MDPLTHVASGLLLSQLLPGPSRAWSALAGVTLSMLPDLDYLLVYLNRLAFLRHHRGFTHSLLAVPLFALLMAGVGQALGGARWFRPLFLMGLAALGLHILLDLATSYGTQILNPLSSRKYTLDWLFIIDPYLFALMTVGAAAALLSPGWGQQVGALCLALAGAYFLVCGWYHHQALDLARQVFKGEAARGAELAALPQPFSCRRWQLLAAAPGEVKQALVQLPVFPGGHAGPYLATETPGRFTNPNPRAPAPDYREPGELMVISWRPLPWPEVDLSPEARRILDTYLNFARFPLLAWAEPQGEGVLLKWLDLRFTVPGRPFPFVLLLLLDRHGQLQGWEMGPRGLPRQH
jgi:inner membrane protein